MKNCSISISAVAVSRREVAAHERLVEQDVLGVCADGKSVAGKHGTETDLTANTSRQRAKDAGVKEWNQGQTLLLHLLPGTRYCLKRPVLSI